MISNRHSVTLLSVLTILFLTTCKPEKEEPKPTTLASVITGEVTNTTTTTAKVGGQVVVDGNTAVTERGVVIGENTDPTIGDTKIAGGTGVGTFSVDVSGLIANTTYHVRAFATNAVGTSYGLDKSFTTSATIPTVTTTSISEITIATSKGGGNITDDGGSAITARGVCWSLNPNPTIADSVSVNGTGSGSFVSSLSKLNSNTTYYVRAYATNSVGTAYGPEITFSTPTSPIPTNGLVGWWPFNGNANDGSGNGNDGNVNGSTLIEDRFGINNSAMNFDGNDWIEVPFSNSIGVQYNFSSSVWIYMENGGCNPRIYEIHEVVDCGGYNLMVWGTSNIERSLTGGFGKCTGSYLGIPDTNVTSLNWHHIAVVMDGINGVGRIYVDGQEANYFTSGTIPEINYYGASLFIGNINPGRCDFWGGKLDDIAIYNRALTAEEIQKIYNGTGF